MIRKLRKLLPTCIRKLRVIQGLCYKIFQSCSTYRELMSYSRPRLVENFKDFYYRISIFKDEIEFILGRVALNETVDLSAEVRFRGKYTSREHIVDNVFMA